MPAHLFSASQNPLSAKTGPVIYFTKWLPLNVPTISFYSDVHGGWEKERPTPNFIVWPFQKASLYRGCARLCVWVSPSPHTMHVNCQIRIHRKGAKSAEGSFSVKGRGDVNRNGGCGNRKKERVNLGEYYHRGEDWRGILSISCGLGYGWFCKLFRMMLQ